MREAVEFNEMTLVPSPCDKDTEDLNPISKSKGALTGVPFRLVSRRPHLARVRRVLSQAPELNFSGTVMIDSGLPGALNSRSNAVVPHEPFVTEQCKPEIRFFIRAMLKSSAKLLDSWVLPV